MASIAQAPLRVTPSNVAASIFTSQGPEIFDIMRFHGFPDEASDRIVDYLIGSEDPFGAKQWHRYFTVDVGLDCKLPESFYTFWNGADPIDPEKKVYETHLPPVLRPRFLTHIETRTLHSFTLRTLDALVDHPAVGNPIRFFRVSPLSDPLQIVKVTKAGPSCWLVLRKEVVARGKCYDEQIGYVEEVNAETGAGYEVGPSVIDLATVLFARYVAKRECYIGNQLGFEDCTTFSTCSELSRDSDHSYFDSRSCQVAIGGFSSAGLHLSTARFPEDCYGIACVRKF